MILGTFVISGGRGSSKSFGVGTFTSLLSFEKDTRFYLLGRP